MGIALQPDVPFAPTLPCMAGTGTKKGQEDVEVQGQCDWDHWAIANRRRMRCASPWPRLAQPTRRLVGPSAIVCRHGPAEGLRGNFANPIWGNATRLLAEGMNGPGGAAERTVRNPGGGVTLPGENKKWRLGEARNAPTPRVRQAKSPSSAERKAAEGRDPMNFHFGAASADYWFILCTSSPSRSCRGNHRRAGRRTRRAPSTALLLRETNFKKKQKNKTNKNFKAPAPVMALHTRS